MVMGYWLLAEIITASRLLGLGIVILSSVILVRLRT
jgi:drug/metabolite transporter (DMT)-like permease